MTANNVLSEVELVDLIFSTIKQWAVDEMGENDDDIPPATRLAETFEGLLTSLGEVYRDQYHNWHPDDSEKTCGTAMPPHNLEQPEEFIIRQTQCGYDPYTCVRDLVDEYLEKNVKVLGEHSLNRIEAKRMLYGDFEGIDPVTVTAYKHIFPGFLGRTERLSRALGRMCIRHDVMEYLGDKDRLPPNMCPVDLVKGTYGIMPGSPDVRQNIRNLEQVIRVFGDCLNEICFGTADDLNLNAMREKAASS